MTNHQGIKLKGKLNGSYVLNNEISRGSYGIVYLAYDDDGTCLACKMIGPVNDQMYITSFNQEIASAIDLDNPNILKIVDYGDVLIDSSYWLFVLSEYCPDGNYRQVLNTYLVSQPSIDDVICDMRQMLNGLKALHSRIIHRDIKPENLLVANGVIKVADFGLAKFVDTATRSLTFKGLGSPLYMAPESWLVKRATPATDLYAIGVIFYEALTGEPPFRQIDINQLRDDHLYTSAPRVKIKNPSVPDYIDGMIKKLLIKDQNQRFQSADEIIADLDIFSNTPLPTTVGTIIDRIRSHHDVSEELQLKEEQKIALQKSEQSMNLYMEKELTSMIDEVISEINSHLIETSIIRESNYKNISYRFGKRNLRIHFFTSGELFRDPEVPGRMVYLRKRHAVHGGFIEIQENGQDREGWNFVLTRSPDDTYGEWYIVETRMSGLSGHRTVYEPVATEARLFADNLACHWAHVMHIYNLTDKKLEREDIYKIVDVFIPK
jgi:serine/threonine protein kinase